MTIKGLRDGLIQDLAENAYDTYWFGLEGTKMICEALDKQIPKHPHLEGDGYDGNGYMIYDTWICPCCEKHYEVDYDKYEHCPSCGQCIDWSDNEN